MRFNILGRVAVLILVLAAVGAASFIIINRDGTTRYIEQQALSEQRESLQLDIPDAPWEPQFFESLAERTKAANISNLRAQQLLHDDLEIRFWYDHFEIISGVVIRHTGQEWSASWIYQTQDHQPASATQLKLNSPKSGWETLWNNLVTTGVLTLPDSSETKCGNEALDGFSYIVETNINRKYRTYRYGNPQLATCLEPKRMMQIEEIIRQEFRLWDLKG